MLQTIKRVLDDQELQVVADLLGAVQFVDGRASAGKAAGRVKRNQEASAHPNLTALSNLVMGNLLRHPQCRLAALPRQVAQPLFARYGEDMAYGDHIDDPIMGGEHPFRTDIAVTLFLNSPADYEGGELQVETPFGAQALKLPAGDAVLYPADTRHRVSAVTRGQRLVAVTWIQSLVRDPARRQLLYDLGTARERMLDEQPEGANTRLVDKSYVNLVRMWAEV